MIGTLKGIITVKKPYMLVLDVNGVGYEVIVPLSDFPEKGSELFLYIYTYVKEDAIRLYGFAAEEQKALFLSIIGVSGIGPKAALSVLSTFNVNDFRQAIETENIKLLSKIPGIGNKTANRLILELKDKLPKSDTTKDSNYDDAQTALISLGYKRLAVSKALDAVYSKGRVNDIEEIIKASLRLLSQKEPSN
ncbi:Bacterial DNA recombination protein RuvA [Candidatus Magnetoovum chiemensis]|nr:Bacterial DNA recombination protein RuvA [Candidatus Magnetoovum chiemensis]